MGKTFRRGGNEGGYYSFGKSIRDKRQKGGTNRSSWGENYEENFQSKGGKKGRKKFDSDVEGETGWY
jgi:hypothetical protein